MEPDLYEVLQVRPNAEPEVIDAAFRGLTRKYHPDVNPSTEATETMGRLTAAYEVLRDPDRRAAYDRQRMARRNRNRPAQRPPRAVPSNTGAHEEGIEVSLLDGLAALGIKWRKRTPGR